MAYLGDTKSDCQCGAFLSNRGHARWSHLRGQAHIAWERAHGNRELADWLADDKKRRIGREANPDASA